MRNTQTQIESDSWNSQKSTRTGATANILKQILRHDKLARLRRTASDPDIETGRTEPIKPDQQRVKRTDAP